MQIQIDMLLWLLKPFFPGKVYVHRCHEPAPVKNDTWNLTHRCSILTTPKSKQTNILAIICLGSPRLLFRILHVKDSLLPWDKVWSAWTFWVKLRVFPTKDQMQPKYQNFHKIQQLLGDSTATKSQSHTTVDGWNPAPPRMMITPLFIGFHTSQVVQDFFHQQ